MRLRFLGGVELNRADLEVIRRRCHRTQWFSPDAERDREALLEYVDRLLKVVDVADHLVGAVEDDARSCPCCDDNNEFLPCICTRAMVAPKALIIYHDARRTLEVP